MQYRVLPGIIAVTAFFAAGCDNALPTETPDRVASLFSAEKTVLVGFDAKPGAAEIALIKQHGGRVTHQYKYIPFLVATIPAYQEDVLRAAASVASVENNVQLVPFGGRQIVDYGVQRIEARAAWLLGYEGQGVKVGVFDSGIDLEHPDLNVVGGIDLVGDGRGLDDCHGHGTHVAGIIGARNDSLHTVGVAPAAQLYSMRMADCAWAGATLAKMVQGLEWAIDNGMDVINMSFGFGVLGVSSPTLVPSSPAGDAALDQAYQAGIVLFAASGNSHTPYVGYPASHSAVIAVGATDEHDNLGSFSQFGTDQELTAPGVGTLASYLVGEGLETTVLVHTDHDRLMTAIPLTYSGLTPQSGVTGDAIYAGSGSVVEFAAVDCKNRIALVTRGGPTFAMQAEAAMNAGCIGLVIHNNYPGNFNGSLGTATTSDGRPWLPTVSISLNDGVSVARDGETTPATLSVINAPGDVTRLSGTSMASPHGAGVAALILSKSPALGPDQVRAILRNSAHDLGVAGWDPVYGYGRINARRAVE